MKRMLLTGLLIASFFMAIPAADEIKFRGFVQTWFSVGPNNTSGDTQYGFQLRRVRLTPYGTLGKKFSWAIALDWDRQKPRLLDAYLDWAIQPAFKLRFGQFPAPGALSGALTPSGALDFLDRAAVADQWGTNSQLSAWRAIGVQVHGDLFKNKFYYALMFGNPRTVELFTPAASSSTYDYKYNGWSFWGRLEVKPVDGLRIGGFYGSAAEKLDDVERSSYGASIYYAKKPLNLKAEYISGKNTGVGYNGAFVSAGIRSGKIEPMVRWDTYSPKDGVADAAGVTRYNNYTLGLNYYTTDKVKFQVNYVLRKEQGTELKNNLFYICFQYSYPGQ